MLIVGSSNSSQDLRTQIRGKERIVRTGAPSGREARRERTVGNIFSTRAESEYLNSRIVMRFVAPASLNGAGVVSTSKQSLTL